MIHFVMPHFKITKFLDIILKQNVETVRISLFPTPTIKKLNLFAHLCWTCRDFQGLVFTKRIIYTCYLKTGFNAS